MKKMVFSLTIGVAAAFLIHDVTSADITHSLSFSSSDMIFSEKGEYDVVEMEGCNFSTDIVGAPQLPAKVIQLVIPQDAEVESIAITDKTSEKIDGDYYIYPLQPPAKTDGSPPPYFVAPDPYWYTSNLPYPDKVVELVGSGYRSEYHIVTLKVYPIQYTPADSSPVLHTYISFSLKTKASPNRGVPVYRRSEISQNVIDRTVKVLVENPDDIDGCGDGKSIVELSKKPEKLNITSLPSLEGHCVDCVIITSPDLEDQFSGLTDWKTQKGVITVTKTLPWIESHYFGCDLQERIRNFIKDAYSYWGTIRVLVGGDTRVVPPRKVLGEHPTDLYYSDLEGNWNDNGNSIFGDGPIATTAYSVDFVSNTMGWAAGDNKVFCTTDGGDVWRTRILETSQRQFDICFVDPDSGWTVGDSGTVFHTSDGGLSWDLQRGKDKDWLFGVYFVDTDTGWAAGRNDSSSTKGIIIHTTNSGEDWLPQTSNTNYTLTGVFFVDADTGWVVGAQGTVLHTTNGGQVWLPQQSGTSQYLWGVHFVDSRTGWIVGISGTVLHTEAGGDTWVPQESGTSMDLWDVEFVDANTGWAVGNGGTIIHTTTGGDTWTAQVSGRTERLRGLSFIDSQEGWAVGHGAFLHTTDGGANWVTQTGTVPGDSLDLNANLFLGRAPVDETNEVNVFFNKLSTYEKDPPREYLTRILLLGGSREAGGDGNGCIIKENLQLHDWYPDASEFFTWELYGPKDDPTGEHRWHGNAEINRDTTIGSINSGFHFLNHIDHSGAYVMGTGHATDGGKIAKADVAALTNATQYCIVWTLGCNANAFDYESISEAFINNPNGGAIAYVGYTRAGSWDHADQDRRFFEALFGDSLCHIGSAFSTTQISAYGLHAYNTNLLGDPEMPVWTDDPNELVVLHPDTIDMGPQDFTVAVADTANQPVDSALVCLRKGFEAYARGFTDQNGLVTFVSYEPETPGSLTVAVIKMNFIPYEGICTVNPVGSPYIHFYSHSIDDDDSGGSAGNADSIVNPGETIELSVTLRNSGGTLGQSVSGTLSASDTFVILMVDTQSFGNILPESTATSFNPYVFTVLANRPDTLDPEIPFSLEITSTSGDTWGDDFRVPIMWDSLLHTTHETVGGVSPNDTVSLDSLGITNYGWGAADSVYAILRTDDTLITIIDSTALFGEISGLTQVVGSDSLVFSVGDSVPSQFSFTVLMRDRFGREWSQTVDLSPPYPPDRSWICSYGSSFIDLCWEYIGPRPGDLLGYNVYRSNSPTSGFIKANAFIVQGASIFEDEGLTPYTDYYYSVTAVDSSANESPASDTTCVRTSPPYQAGWPQVIGPACGSSPAVGDLDGDGDLEAVMASGRKVYVWRHTGASATGWPKELGAPNNSSPGLADLDFDGDLEIIIGGDSVYAWNHNGTPVNCENNPNLPPGSPGWPQPKSFNPVYVPSPSPTIGDIDGDGYLEVIIGDEAGGVHAWHYTGSQVEGSWPVTVEGAVVATPAIGNLDEDEELEVVIGTWHDNGYVYVLNHDGTVYWVDTTGGANCASPVLGDLDCDGELEVVVGSLAPRVYVWRCGGTLLEGWPQYTTYGLFRCPALADLDGDDSLEVVAATAGQAEGCAYLRAWDYHGAEIFEPVSLGYHSIITMSPAVGDMDGDGDVELLVGCWDGLFYWNNRLHLYEADGSEVLQGFPIFLTGRSSSSPALADLDRDGDTEILMGSDEERMYVWDLPAEYGPDRIEWGMFHHDMWHTGNYHWQIGLYSSSPLATAYNGGRNLCRVSNTDDLWLAYQSTKGVYAALSEDGGKSWLGSYLGNGGFPTIAVTPPPEQGPGTPPYPVMVWTAPEPNPTALWCARLWQGDWQTGVLHQDPNETPHLPSMIIDSYEPQSHAHLAWEAIDLANVRYLSYGTFQPDDPNWPPSFYPGRIDSVPGFDWHMSPCVDVDYLTGTGVPRPHIVYKKADYIYHAMPVVGGWALDLISQPGYTSSFPFVQVWGDIIHAMWAGDASLGSSVDEIWYRTRHVYGTEWSDFINISESPADSSRFPAMSGGYGSWSERYSGGTLPVNWEIMLKDIFFSYPSPPEDISETAQRSMFSHINYRQMQQEPRCLYFIWTEGDAPVYQVKSLEYPLYHPAIPLYYVETGQEEPSFYCVERDSFIQFGPEPHKQVDLDSTQLLYRLPGLKPYMRYQLVVTGYWEGSEGIEERVDIDGTAERVLKLSPGVPETLAIWVPPASFREDRSVDVTITLLEGDWVVVGPMILYEFEKEEEALLLAEGGSQSAEAYWLTPRVFGLCQSYPNPFSGATTIRYQLPKEVQVRLNIYNICGQLVRTIVDEKQKPGYYAIRWDGRDASTRKLASGVYFYRLTAGEFTATRKMVVLR